MVAVLPQFSDPSQGHITLQLIVLGSLSPLSPSPWTASGRWPPGRSRTGSRRRLEGWLPLGGAW